MAYFTQDYIDFFQDLARNNHKTWFHEHKKQYENAVKKPMLAFVEDLIAKMQLHDPEINPNPKKCIGRINRDIRFSKDKTPYNTHLFANISKGTKEHPLPGIAFRIGAGDSGIMGGYYKPDKDTILHIRQRIANDTATFQQLKSDKNFIEQFGAIQGEALKRIPKEFKDIFEQEPLIANKQFYYLKHAAPEFFLQENILDIVLNHWLAAKPLNDFLSAS